MIFLITAGTIADNSIQLDSVDLKFFRSPLGEKENYLFAALAILSAPAYH